jgi:hypothetical protein
VVALAALVLAAAACGASADVDAAPTTTSAQATTLATPPSSTVPTTTITGTTTPNTTVPPEPGTVRPDWLGTRPLPLAPNGFGEVLPTPPELVNRRFPTIDMLPPPTDGFVATIEPVPADVAARSTWSDVCPVALDELRYVTVSFWGFEGKTHTGELLVNAAVADDIAGVFRALYDGRFPIEEMRVVRADELGLPPTGDGNNTSAFVCRQVVGSTSWSQHAYGLAIDIDPFQNPYVKGDVLLPELASAYLDRSDVRPGMIESGDAVTKAFAAIGWIWGGEFRSLTDAMHFSANGT